MPDSSPVLALPYLQAAQAQKHVTLNEALERLDLLVQMRVAGFDAQTPPDLPQEGEMYALGAGPTGVWAGQGGRLAACLDDGWRFFDPQQGWRAWGIAEGELRVFDGSAWTRIMGASDNLAGLGIKTGADPVNRLAVRAQATLLSHEGAGHQLKINKAAAGDTASLLFQSGWTGHAEMGLAGDTDFSVKVSADGATWTEALRFGAASGLASGAAVQTSPTDITPGRLMRTDFGYCPGNVTGSVAQSGGVPTGAVIERGANANGQYVRWADGTQICWHRTETPAPENSWGALYRSALFNWTYPAVFSADPSTSVSVDQDSMWAGITSRRPSAAGRVINSASSALNRMVALTAIGRWY